MPQIRGAHRQHATARTKAKMMTTTQITKCDVCNAEISSDGYSYNLSTSGGIGQYRHLSDPLPQAKDFCSYRCLATFVAQGDPSRLVNAPITRR
jgi:hypothetical protein